MIKKQYKFKIDFKVTATREYTKGTIISINSDGTGYTIDDSNTRMIEKYFVENNSALFEDVSKYSSKLIDDNRYFITKLSKNMTDYTVMHQAGSNLYVRMGVSGTPFLLNASSAIGQFNVVEYNDSKKNVTYKVGMRVKVLGLAASTIDSISFDGTITTSKGKAKLDFYIKASTVFKAYDGDVTWPNPGYAVDINTGVETQVAFDDISKLNLDKCKIFALKSSREAYMYSPVHSELSLDRAKLTSVIKEKA